MFSHYFSLPSLPRFSLCPREQSLKREKSEQNEQSTNQSCRKHAYQNLKPTAEESAGGSPAPGHAHMQHHQHSFSAAEALANGSVNPVDISHGNFLSESHSVSSVDQDEEMGNYHVPHNLCMTRLFLSLFLTFRVLFDFFVTCGGPQLTMARQSNGLF
jgi:hypothetical protein